MKKVSEKLLQQILHELKEIKVEQQGMKTELQELKVEVHEIKVEQQEMKAEVQEIKVEQQEMRAEVQEIKVEQQEMRTGVQAIKVEQQGMRTELQEVKAEQRLMSAKLDENIQITHAIFDRQEETDAKLGALTMDVHKIHGEITSIKEEQTLHSSILQQLAAGQARQEKILERLSFRSIEHESDIAELRRAK